MKFFVVIRATVETACQNMPSEIKFELTRPSRPGFAGIKTGFLILSFSDPDHPVDRPGGKKLYTYRTYLFSSQRGVTDWIVTKVKGRWNIKVQNPAGKNYTSNTAVFKVLKRDQIVAVANSWANTNRQGLNCNRFVARVFDHVAVIIDGSTVSEVWRSTREYGSPVDDKPASIVVYRSAGFMPQAQWGDNSQSAQDAGIAAHVAIRIGGGLVADANCGLSPTQNVHSHSESAPLDNFPGIQTPAVAQPHKKDRTAPELVVLDGE